MSSSNTSDRIELAPWQVGDLRLTAFPVPSAPHVTLAESKRWQALVGQPPERINSRNFETEIEESGPFAPGVNLVYLRSAQAIQWMLHGIANVNKPESVALMNPE